MLVWSVDVLLVIFRLFRWLKPGGVLLVLDYCKPNSGSSSTGLEEYIGELEWFKQHLCMP